MPDGLTHIVAGFIGGWRWFRGYRMTLFLAGSLLPDLFLRGGRIFLVGQLERDFLELYLVPLHTPITCALLCGAVAFVFDPRIRKTAFVTLLSGCFGHFILDFLQRGIEGYGPRLIHVDGYRWLYPFTWYDAQFGLFWAEDSPYALIILVPAILFVWIKQRKNQTSD